MAKTVVCDRCHKEFGGPLDEERFSGENGTTYTLDLCAPCRKVLYEARKEVEKSYFEEVLNKKNG